MMKSVSLNIKGQRLRANNTYLIRNTGYNQDVNALVPAIIRFSFIRDCESELEISTMQ